MVDVVVSSLRACDAAMEVMTSAMCGWRCSVVVESVRCRYGSDDLSNVWLTL